MPFPIHPDVALWRPATGADADAITRAQKAMDAVDHPDWTTPQEDIADELASEKVELARDSVLGVGAGGDVLAWGLVEAIPGSQRIQALLSGGVVPQVRGRGIGRELLGWQLARGREAIGEHRVGGDGDRPAWVRSGVDERNPSGIALRERLGMRPERWFTTMERDLRSLPEHLDGAGDGVAIVGYLPERSEETRAVKNAAFADHWGSRETSRHAWEQFVGSGLFRADLSFHALDSAGGVAGFALVNANPEDWELQGYTSAYLGMLGVVRQARGRGVARRLLVACLGAARAAGLERVVLDVDTASPTGALGLYERAGFVATTRSVEYVLDVPR